MKNYSLNHKNQIINEITRKGFCIVNDVFHKKEIEKYKTNIKYIYKRRLKLGLSVGSTNNQCIYNFFQENLDLMPLVYIKKIDKILEKLLDENYVYNQVMRRMDRLKKLKKIGKILKLEIIGIQTQDMLTTEESLTRFSYLVIIALEDFTKHTASTQYIKDSLKEFSKPKDLLKKYNTLEMKSGSICIMDTGITHKWKTNQNI